MTGTSTSGGGPLRRRDAFVGERLSGGGAAAAGPAHVEAVPAGLVAGDVVLDEIDHRLEQARAFKEAKAAASAAGGAGLVASPAGPNWIPLGPFGAVAGQAASHPVVSGRVQDIALSSEGQRVYLATAEGGVWRSLDAGRTWEPLTDSLDLMETGGVPVTALVSSLSTGAIALAEGADAATDRLYVGTGEPQAGVAVSPDLFGVGMLRSADGGRTWAVEASNPDLRGSGSYALALDPGDRDHLLAATQRGIYRRTAASAATATPWNRETLPGLAAGANVTCVVAGRLAGATAFWACVNGGTVFQWTQAGGWTALPNLPSAAPAGAPARITLAVSAGDSPMLYALAAKASDNHLHGVHRYDVVAAPAAWTTVSGAPARLFGPDPAKQGQGWYDQVIAVDPTDPNTVYVGGSTESIGGEYGAALYRLGVTAAGPGGGGALTCTSTALGGSVHADLHAATMRPGVADELWIGCDGGVFVSRTPRGTGDSLFTSCNAGLSLVTFNGVTHLPGEDSYAFAGAQDNGGLRYAGSEVWDHQLPGDGGPTVVDYRPRAGSAGGKLLNIYTGTTVRRADLAAGRYDYSAVGPGTVPCLFYPPLAQVPPTFAGLDFATAINPADAAVVAFGADVPYVSTQFGGAWIALPMRTPAAGGALVRSLAFASSNRLWAGWTDGHMARYDLTGAGWACTDTPRGAGENRPVTSIAIDPAAVNGEAVYVTFGGRSNGAARVWQVAAPAAGPVAWTAAGAGLLDIQHNSIVLDQRDPSGNTRWVGADLGVWRWDAGTSTWQVLSDALPDAAVLGLDLLESHNLLRASTYGRGLWELDLSPGPQAPVRLTLRASAADRGRPGRLAATAAALNAAAPLDASPDLAVDAPDGTGRYTVPPGPGTPTLVELRSLAGRKNVLVSVPETPVTTRVHVTVRNRGVRAADAPVDGVRVALLVGPAGANDTSAITDLPAGYTAIPRNGTTVEADGWKVVGIQSLNGLRAGRPGVASFDLGSALLPAVGDGEGKRFALVALVHHGDDPFPDPSPRVVLDLVQAEPRAAVLRVTAVAAGSGAATGGAGAGGGVGAIPGQGDADGGPVLTGAAAHAPGSLLVPLTTALLAHQRLGDVADQLTRKVTATRVTPNGLPGSTAVRPHPVERRVLALATAARDAQRAGTPSGVPNHLPGNQIGAFALLGALGFELPAFASVSRPDSAWVATALRRGTPDPNRSRVAVPSTELPLAVGAAGVAAAGANATTKAAAVSFGHGMLAAAAAGVAVGPQLTDLLAGQTRADWSRGACSDGAVAVDQLLRARFLANRDGSVGSPALWLPPAKGVPDAVWTGFVTGVENTYHLTANRPKGLPAFEAGFDAGSVPGTSRLETAYALLQDNLRGEGWPAIAWFGLLTPVLLAPPLAMLAAHDLPHAKALFGASGVDGGKGERAVFELLVTGMGLGSVSPLIYSIIGSAALGEETEALVTSILFGIARAGLVGGALGSAGDAGQSDLTRWLGLFLPLVSMDVYSAIRAGISWDSHPALATVLLWQTVPAMTGLLTLGVTGLLNAAGIEDISDWPFWLAWGLFTAALWFGAGIPLAVKLAGGGSWRAWMLHAHRRSPLLEAVAATGLLPPEPVAAARVLDDSTLWADPDATPTGGPAGDLAGRSYPSGASPLVALWWEGAGDLTLRYAEDLVTLKPSGSAETPVRIPAGTNAAALAQLLGAALAGVKCEVVATGAPDPALDWPATVDDPGVAGRVGASATARARFVPVGTKKKNALVIRHAPRADLSTRAGLAAVDPTAFPVVPTAGLGDLDGSGLGAAADLAVLLAMAASPSFGAVSVNDGLPALPAPAVGEVVQVFRRWNLDERRLAEWQRVVSGGAPTEGPPAAPAPAWPDPLYRTPPAPGYAPQPVGADLVSAMGWIPLWRSWLRVASDLQADAAAPFALPSTPLVRFPDGAVRRPTNAELTEGIRFLLDLGST